MPVTLHVYGYMLGMYAYKYDAMFLMYLLIKCHLQAIGPELTFYNKSKNAGEVSLSNKLLHAEMDAFCR